MALWFCLNVYNEEQYLHRCLSAIRENHPEARICAVDGAYASLINEMNKEISRLKDNGMSKASQKYEKFTIPWSTDRTMEILCEYGVDVVIPTKKPWEHEWVKRSKYFVGGKGDYYAVIDADEKLVGRVQTEALTDEAYNFLLKRTDQVQPYGVLRIFRHSNDIRYHKVHHALFRGEKLYRREDCKTLTTCYLEHDVTSRVEKDRARHEVKGFYYRYLTSVEEREARAIWKL